MSGLLLSATQFISGAQYTCLDRGPEEGRRSSEWIKKRLERLLGKCRAEQSLARIEVFGTGQSVNKVPQRWTQQLQKKDNMLLMAHMSDVMGNGSWDI